MHLVLLKELFALMFLQICVQTVFMMSFFKYKLNSDEKDKWDYLLLLGYGA